MIRYSVQPRDQIFPKGYGSLSFAKNRGKNIGKNINKNLSRKYSPSILAMSKKLLDHAEQSTTDAFKTASERAIQKTAEGGDLIDNKSANKITKVSKNSQQNN